MTQQTHQAFEVASVNREGTDTAIAGILIDPETMRPFVSDEKAAEHSMLFGSPTDQVVIHLARGELSKAGELIAESRLTDPTNAHLRVLDTELTRARGDFDRAINRLRALLEEFAGTEYESLMQHHLGMSYYERGDYHAAATRFRTALQMREESGGRPHLIDASRICLQMAEEKLAQHG
ncbi:tetratricopeptide repeat protein [Glutamicibacter sp. PS]|uniref:tetratricopeptide repeat protein n=1 Tax=Glutamicibacter sp. PS TaxID=3075634 RepID=UPI00284D8640|nr:tetratricopeptide repeat protein [Glutamicibacter sp. PS]MDR4532741.1 tetratricopeptide repeat protein [Glutamicibacter sp. PS]